MKVEDMSVEQLRNAVTWWRTFGVSVWEQYASYNDMKGKVRYSNMCLSVLEDLEEALRKLDLINKNGKPKQ